MSSDTPDETSFQNALKNLVVPRQPTTGTEKALFDIDQAIRAKYGIGLTAALQDFWGGRELAEAEDFNSIVQCIRSLRGLRGPAPIPQSGGSAGPQPGAS